MFLIDDFFKKILDVTVDYFKYKINNSIKIKIDIINGVFPNGLTCMCIKIINNSKNEIILNNLKIKYNFLTDGGKILMEYQDLTWIKLKLKSKDDHIYTFGHYQSIIETNADNYFYILIQVDNNKIIRKKIKY